MLSWKKTPVVKRKLCFCYPQLEKKRNFGKILQCSIFKWKKRNEGQPCQRLGYVLQKDQLGTLDMSKRNLSRESLLASFQICWRLFILDKEEKLKNKIQCKGWNIFENKNTKRKTLKNCFRYFLKAFKYFWWKKYFQKFCLLSDYGYRNEALLKVVLTQYYAGSSCKQSIFWFLNLFGLHFN